MISVIGKGSYGKVMLVKKIEGGQLYALKVLKKAEIIRRNQVEHTMTERRILVSISFSLTYLYRKISAIHSWSKWIMPFKAIVNYSLSQNTVQEVSFSSTCLKLAASRKTQPDSTLQTFCLHYIIFIHKIFFTEILNQRMYLQQLMVMLKQQTLVFQKKILLDITRLRVFAAPPSIQLLKFYREWVMVKPVIGGVLEESFTKCFVGNHPSTVKTKKSSSET